MAHYVAATATAEIHTYKEGLLAAMGHDLKIQVTRFSIDVADDRRSLTATFDPNSLSVVSALDGSALSDKDKREIEANIHKKILHPDRHPKIGFTSTAVEPSGDGIRITGELHLHGTTRTLSVSSHREGNQQIVEVPINQPDFGIKPFRAPLGIIKIKPEIQIRISLPADATAT